MEVDEVDKVDVRGKSEASFSWQFVSFSDAGDARKRTCVTHSDYHVCSVSLTTA